MPQASFGDSRDKVHVRIVPDRLRVATGGDVLIALIFEIEKSWHIYAGDQPLPDDYFKTVVVAEAVQSSQAAMSPLAAHPGFIQWPAHRTIDFFGDKLPVYEHRAIAYLPVTVALDAPVGPATIRIKPAFQACDDRTCLRQTPYPPKPGEPAPQEWLEYGHDVTLEIVDPASLTAADVNSDPAIFGGFDPSVWMAIHSGQAPDQRVPFDLFGLQFSINASSAIGLLLLLLVAALGGFLLNFTPCVLPVIPIKIISLSKSAGNRQRTLALGVAMFVGVIAFWVALGAVIASVSRFTATNQLYQYPAFTIGLGVFIAVMAIGMCGLFALRLPNAVYSVSPKLESYSGSFLFGVMTAVLATPCIAPFMGVAAAWALTQAAVIATGVFFAIGFGMGLPYFVLSAFPRLVERMPRSGPASELIKQVMGLLMLSAAAYFIGVGLSGLLVTPPEPPVRLYLWVVAGFIAAAGAWLLYRTMQISSAPAKRLVFGGLGAITVLAAIIGGFAFTDTGPINWTYYTPERFAAAQRAGNVVVMEFTAEWCLNCKALERTVLSHPDIARIMNGPGVTPIKVDLTGNNALGNQMLTSVNRRSIPLLVVFAPDGREAFKGDFYTVGQVLDAVRDARGQRVAER